MLLQVLETPIAAVECLAKELQAACQEATVDLKLMGTLAFDNNVDKSLNLLFAKITFLVPQS